MQATDRSSGRHRIAITFYQRKPRPTGNFSLEAIFADVRRRLSSEIDTTLRIAPRYSNGVWPRLLIIFDAWRHRSETTHVTGDIQFAAILRRRENTILTILDCGDLIGRSDFRAQFIKLLWFVLPSRKASYITTISEASKREIITITGFPADRIHVIGVAISESFKRVDRPFNRECPRVLQVGTAFNKNVERLAAALCGVECHLTIVGELSQSQVHALTRSGIQYKNLVNISEEELVKQYNQCDIVAFVSTFEGFGMPIIEGQVVGRPVVTSNCSSMPEVAGEGACLVNPFDVGSIHAGVLRIINDDTFRKRIVDAGFINARRFEADSIAREYLAVYRKVKQLCATSI